MNAIIDVLPKSWQPYAKSIVGFLGITLTVVSGTVHDIPIWVTIVLGVLATGSVYAAPAPGYVAPSDQVAEEPMLGEPIPGAVLPDDLAEEDLR